MYTLTHAPAPVSTHREDLNSRIENSSLCTYEGNLCPCPSSFLASRFRETTWHCPPHPRSGHHQGGFACRKSDVWHSTWLVGTVWSHSSIHYKCLLVLSAMYSGISFRSLVLSQPPVKRFSPYLITMRSVLKVDWPETCLKSFWSGILGQC